MLKIVIFFSSRTHFLKPQLKKDFEGRFVCFFFSRRRYSNLVDRSGRLTPSVRATGTVCTCDWPCPYVRMTLSLCRDEWGCPYVRLTLSVGMSDPVRTCDWPRPYVQQALSSLVEGVGRREGGGEGGGGGGRGVGFVWGFLLLSTIFGPSLKDFCLLILFSRNLFEANREMIHDYQKHIAQEFPTSNHKRRKESDHENLFSKIPTKWATLYSKRKSYYVLTRPIQ